MDRPTKCLPQQTLQSPLGARLVLCNCDAGYPDITDPCCPGKGRWFDNWAGSDAETFLRASNNQRNRSRESSDDYLPWRWPAVVLLPEECKLRVGGMSLMDLRWQLEKYWGRGGIPGACREGEYEDMWVHAWAPDYPAVQGHEPTPDTHDPYNLLWCRTQKKPARLEKNLLDLTAQYSVVG